MGTLNLEPWATSLKWKIHLYLLKASFYSCVKAALGTKFSVNAQCCIKARLNYACSVPPQPSIKYIAVGELLCKCI